MKPIRTAALCALAAMTTPLFAATDDSGATLTPEEQFALISSWEGRWQVAETSALEIVFEKTARGSAMIERWETQAGLHSITVYHMDGDALMATHYCPQGNQPRLETRAVASGEIRFTFRDVSDLDEGEGHTHDLWFTPGENETIRRSEIYRSGEELGEPSHYTLKRAPAGD